MAKKPKKQKIPPALFHSRHVLVVKRNHDWIPEGYDTTGSVTIKGIIFTAQYATQEQMESALAYCVLNPNKVTYYANQEAFYIANPDFDTDID